MSPSPSPKNEEAKPERKPDNPIGSKTRSDPRAICERTRLELIWKKMAYEKQINFMQQIVRMLDGAIQETEKELKELK